MNIYETVKNFFKAVSDAPTRSEMIQSDRKCDPDPFPIDKEDDGVWVENGYSLREYNEWRKSEQDERFRTPDEPTDLPPEVKVRLLERVWEVIADKDWHTLAELSYATGASEASCSARLRDFRKAKYGEYDIERRYISKGVWQYRIAPSGRVFV